MKILVCISCVPDTTSKINFINNDTEFDVNGVQFVINPNDEFGLTRAMWFKEKNNATVDVINVGEQTNDSVLRKALAIGADKAVRINRKAKANLSIRLSSIFLKNTFNQTKKTNVEPHVTIFPIVSCKLIISKTFIS